MSDALDSQFPLPTVAVNWAAGWFGALPPYAVELAGLRRACCSALFEQLSSTRNGMGCDCAQTTHKVSQLLNYADKLAVVCSEASTKQSNVLNNTHAQLHRRQAPLEFEWTFPAEPDANGLLKACCMRCTLPGFEYLCVISSACVILMGAANENRLRGQYKPAMVLYQQCKELVRSRVATLVGKALSAAQWHQLRRHLLPVQMLPTWLGVLSAKADHCAQLCAIMLTESSNTEQLLCLTRKAYDTILTLSRCARRLLVAEHNLHPHQQLLVDEIYNESICESHRLRIQCMLQEAEPALMTGKAYLVGQMMALCRESAMIVWPEERVLASDDTDNAEEAVYQHVLEKVASMEESASKSVTAGSCTDDTLAYLQQYLASLPRQHWSCFSF